MNEFYKDNLDKLEIAIKELEFEGDNSLEQIEDVIKLVIKWLSEVKENVLKNEFKSIDEEIHFFKYLKPVIVSKLIYYNAIYKIETKKPNDKKAIKKYLNGELRKLKRYFDNNLEFYKYYRTNNSF